MVNTIQDPMKEPRKIVQVGFQELQGNASRTMEAVAKVTTKLSRHENRIGGIERTIGDLRTGNEELKSIVHNLSSGRGARNRTRYGNSGPIVCYNCQVQRREERRNSLNDNPAPQGHPAPSVPNVQGNY